MNKIHGACLILALGLSACGGGGSGGVASTPPPPPPPVAKNTNITDLKASQAFKNDAAGMNVDFDLTTNTGIKGELRPAPLSISYDASSQSYTVSADGISQAFAPADIISNSQGEARYKTNNSYLTLVTTPYTGSVSNKYVGLGFWQTNTVSGSNQNMEFYTFTYGLDTPASGVPRTGKGGFTTDVFGVVSAPGVEPRAFQGPGTFAVDFASGVFSTHSYLTETGLVTGAGTTGGGIELTGAGYLSASDGTFSGNALYGSSYGQAAGPLNGRLYGPNGEELGGSFSGANSNGMTVVGSFTGQSDPTVQIPNLSLTDMTQQQSFYVHFTDNWVGNLNWQNSETFSFSPPTSDLYGGQFTINDKVSSKDPNFTEYQKTFSSSYDSQDVTLQLYKPGSGNGELALTYASFVHYSTVLNYGSGPRPVDLYGAYGFETPNGMLAGKTGTGTYNGVVYGMGRMLNANTSYDIRGSSQFTVDFGAQDFTGFLAMTGTPSDGSSMIDFGQYDISGQLGYTGASGTLTHGGSYVSDVFPIFYGPDGEEIVMPFGFTVPTGASGAGMNVFGVAAAKR